MRYSKFNYCIQTNTLIGLWKQRGPTRCSFFWNKRKHLPRQSCGRHEMFSLEFKELSVASDMQTFATLYSNGNTHSVKYVPVFVGNILGENSVRNLHSSTSIPLTCARCRLNEFFNGSEEFHRNEIAINFALRGAYRLTNLQYFVIVQLAVLT